MKREMLGFMAAAVFTLGTAMTSFGGQWQQDEQGWWYQDEGDNSQAGYPVSTWKTIDGKEYYFDDRGYMLSNTVQDGFRIGSDGARLAEPVVVLGQYKGVEVVVPDTAVPDEELEEQIQLKLEYSYFDAEITDRPAQIGDMVSIDCVGRTDGVVIESTVCEDCEVLLGAGLLAEELERSLIGTNRGDERQVDITFPADYYQPELAGRHVVFDLYVNYVWKDRYPQLNDEFVKKVSDKSTTVEEYRRELRQDLEAERKEAIESRVQDTVLEKVVEDSTFYHLDQAIEHEFNLQLEEMSRYLEQYGYPLAEYAAEFGMGEQEFRDYLKLISMEDMAWEVKAKLAIDAIARQEGISVTEADLIELAEDNYMDVDELIMYYGRETLEKQIRIQKVQKFLAAHAKRITE